MSATLVTVGVALLTIVIFVRRLFATKEVVGGLHSEISLPHVKPVELYHNATSSCSQKVRTCLHEAGVEFEVDHWFCVWVELVILSRQRLLNTCLGPKPKLSNLPGLSSFINTH